MPVGQSRLIDINATQQAMRMANPLQASLAMSQDLAHAISMQQAAPQQQLAQQNAYGAAQGLTGMADNATTPEDKLNLLRRAQDIYNQQGQQAQQNIQGFSGDINQSPLERGGKSAAEIVSLAALANLAASGLTGGVTKTAAKTATKAAPDYSKMTIGQLQEMHQAQMGVSPLAELDQTMRAKDYHGVIEAARKILEASPDSPLAGYQHSLRPYTESAYNGLLGK